MTPKMVYRGGCGSSFDDECASPFFCRGAQRVGLSNFGVAGILIAAKEGFEVNLLGLSLGLDAVRPAVKLPALGRLGLDR